eukprot:TRINITY_DN16764_c0_g1_i1.p1 TRINITY_DN16764_c0_g1~~TRINITY_DN16764_c0_g1_i1.p1  ORF type:complete len:125 (+),score=46.34 TRINITY_DN16764_c0_g1_i1:57-377(+)
MAAAQGGGKTKKKKWSSGKTQEKLANKVFFDKATFEKLYSEVPSYKLITPWVVVDRLKCNSSLARRGLKHLHQKGMISLVSKHGSQLIYTRSASASAAAEDVAVEE